MKISTLALCAAVAAGGALSAACGEPPKPLPPANANAAGPKNDTAKVDPRIVRDEAGPDNSRIAVRQLENGDQVAVRKWDSGPIRKVTRRQPKDGKPKGVRVVYKDGKIVRVEDQETIDHALDWTSAQLDAAAKKSGKTVDDAPARDKAAADDDE
jgi:hypothetical protein